MTSRTCPAGRPETVGWRVLLALTCIDLLFWPQAKGGAAQKENVDAWTAEHFARARQAQSHQSLEVAAEEYRAIVARNPRFAGAQLNLGIVYHQQRKYREAIKAFESTVSLEPQLLGAQLFLGIDEYLVGDLKGALQHLENALQLKPDDRQAGIYLALTHLALDQPEKAAHQLRKTARYSPEDPDIFYEEGRAYLNGMSQGLTLLRRAGSDSAVYHWALAMAAEQKNDQVSAVEEYLKALARDPSIAELYLRVAAPFEKAGLPELAAACFDRYKLLNPARDVASLRQGPVADGSPAARPEILENKEVFRRMWKAMPSVGRGMGLPPVADDSVNRALKKQMSLAKAVDLRGAVQLYLRGDYSQAIEILRKSVGRHVDKWLSAYLLARCFTSKSDYDAAQATLEADLAPYFNLPPVALLRVEIESQLALRCFNWVLAYQPESYLAKLLVAESYAAARQDKEALAVYEEALKLGPQRLGIHLAIGRIYENQLQWESAIQEYQAELVLDSDNAMALAHLGHVCTEARDPDRAIHVIERLLENNPTDGQAYEDLGKDWTLKGDTGKAIAAYERALQYVPDEYDVHYRLYNLYMKAGETARAQSHLAAFKAGENRQRQSYQESMGELLRENTLVSQECDQHSSGKGTCAQQ
jgi:tetratricopeptide (TPR) repeat protein